MVRQDTIWPTESEALFQTGRLPLVCGGNIRQDKCFTYDPLRNTWVARNSLPLPVAYGGATLHKTLGLVTVGGRRTLEGGLSDQLVSTYDGRNFQTAKLPRYASRPCTVWLDDNTLMVSSFSTEVYTISLPTWQITYLASLPAHAAIRLCGLAEKTTGEKVVAVAAGGVGS